ncbi:MAG: hypothetical protein M1153_02010 [Patescibacteria group bacterium]|nr:hypothetical protein [Patescibacteria group bacterium]
MKKDKDIVSIVIGVVVIALIAVGVFVALRQPFASVPGSGVGPAGTSTIATSTYVPPAVGIVQPVLPINEQANVIVDITAAGFSPQIVTIKPGESVIWTNRDRAEHWIAPDQSNPYPSNGTCGSAFNSCRGLNLGESFRFTFTKIGTWDYYDKLNPKFVGQVIVQ